METPGTVGDRQVAVLIDFENVGLNSIQWLFDQVSDVGRIIIKRAYADWSTASNKRDQLLQLGIEPIHLFHSTGSGKNSSDIRLVIDAIDLLYQSPVDTFVIVSSDSDFVPLVSKLRSAGKAVIGAGRQATVSRTLVISCDRYHYLDQDERPRRARAPVARASLQKQDADALLLRAMGAAMDEQGRVIGSKLRETIQRLDPSFDFRALGHSTFAKYLEASSDVKVVRPGGRGDIVVELADLGTAPAKYPKASPAVRVVRPEGRGDIMVEPADLGIAPAVLPPGSAAPADPVAWGPRIDAAWSKRVAKPGDHIPGSRAAADAAEVLGASKLSSSQYKTLQGLLDASEHLRVRWSRDRNSVIRR